MPRIPEEVCPLNLTIARLAVKALKAAPVPYRSRRPPSKLSSTQSSTPVEHPSSTLEEHVPEVEHP